MVVVTVQCSLPCDRPCHHCEKPSRYGLPFSSSTICVIFGANTKEKSSSGGSAMTFDDILAQIIDLLKRQGHVSYTYCISPF
jgi:hypothetical protein